MFVPFFSQTPISFSTSPSFERQVIDDAKNGDWIFWPTGNKEEKIQAENGSSISVPMATSRSDCIFKSNIFPEITAVSYTSDDSLLNSTMWVSSNLIENTLLKNNINNENLNKNSNLPLWQNIKFTMVIDILSILNEGIDYRIELFGEEINSTHKIWKKEFTELANDGTKKIISNQTFNKFPYLKEGYVDFSVNLKSITNPQEYKILFYITNSYVKDGKLCRMVDTTNWVLAPPPEFNLLLSSDTISMRPGDISDILVTIIGNTETQSSGRLGVNNKFNESADIKFLTNETLISSLSNGSSTLQISIPNNVAQYQRFTVPIETNISFPTTVTSKNGETFYNNQSISLKEHSSIILTVLPPLSIAEKLEQFTNNLKPIGELWQIFIGIGTVVVTIAFYFIRKAKNKNDRGQIKQ